VLNAHSSRLSFEFAWKNPVNAWAIQAAIEQAARGELNGRRVVLAGDSLTRQVFISLACILGHLIEDQRVEWIEWCGP
jgi:hypothetical protein